MSGNSLMAVGQPNRFTRQSVQVARKNPVSPMVLRQLIQMVTELGHKVDSALATRPPQVVQVRQVEARPVEVKPPVKAPEEKVDRKKMRTMFD